MNFYNISSTESAQPAMNYNVYSSPVQPVIDPVMQYTYPAQENTVPPYQAAIPVQTADSIQYAIPIESAPVVNVQVEPQQPIMSNTYQPAGLSKPVVVDVVPVEQPAYYQPADLSQSVAANKSMSSQPQSVEKSVVVSNPAENRVNGKIVDEKESWKWLGCPIVTKQVSIFCLVLDILFGPLGVLISACADLNGYNSAVAFVAVIELFTSFLSFGYFLGLVSGILTVIRNANRL